MAKMSKKFDPALPIITHFGLIPYEINLLPVGVASSHEEGSDYFSRLEAAPT